MDLLEATSPAPPPRQSHPRQRGAQEQQGGGFWHWRDGEVGDGGSCRAKDAIGAVDLEAEQAARQDREAVIPALAVRPPVVGQLRKHPIQRMPEAVEERTVHVSGLVGPMEGHEPSVGSMNRERKRTRHRDLAYAPVVASQEGDRVWDARGIDGPPTSWWISGQGRRPVCDIVCTDEGGLGLTRQRGS